VEPGHELEFPSAFRQSRRDGKPRGIVKIRSQAEEEGLDQDRRHPHDTDARITKMKEGRTHLAHKAEYAADLSGLIWLAT